MKYTIKKDTIRTVVIDTTRDNHECLVETRADATIVIPVKEYEGKELTVTIRLVGWGARATIIGVVGGTKKQIINLHTLQHHEAPETTSNLLVKGVLYDEATFVYDGAILVDPKAQKTDAYQRNENLLLSPSAHAKSQPGLEILANDVRCTHGATIGTLSTDQLWYMATRGIGRDVGGRLISDGFVASALEKITDEKVRDTVRQQILGGV